MGWVFSTDEERYSSDEYETKELAIAAAPEELSLNPGEAYFLGQVVKADPEKWMPDADEILEQMGEQAYEEAGEVAESWPDATKEEKDNLTKALRDTINKWMDETGNRPGFYLVENAETLHAPGEYKEEAAT